MIQNETLPSFVRLLRQRYQAVLSRTAPDSPRLPFLQKQEPSLALAEAFLRLNALPSRKPGPLQIAVIGPTQAGKSSLVNCLCRQTAAQVSPLAGHTIHPQGFCLGVNEVGLDWLKAYFSGFQQLPPNQLPRNRYDCYSLTTPPAMPGYHPLAPAVVWDTPDFDSIDAEGYREGVLRAAALADVLLLVVSKDKYADQSVWDMLQLLAPLDQPTVLCLNKTAADSHDLVESSLRQRWTELRGGSPPPVVSLPYRQDWGPDVWRNENAAPAALLEQLLQAADRAQQASHGQQARRLIETHWRDWLTPVLDEHTAETAWERLVNDAVDDAAKLYQRDYLNHPQHYETFQRALSELLTLMEIPGLAKPMRAARQVVTWPMRQLVKMGRRASGEARPGNEQLILGKIIEHLLLRLAEGVLSQREQDNRMHVWWNEMGRLLQNQRDTQQAAFESAVQRYQLNFQGEIEQAAQHLLERLREHPAILNSLRATRATADAATMGLAFLAGGIGLHDFVLAPAVLSFSTLLAESALGRYLHKVEADLKRRQQQTVTSLLRAQAEQILLNLPLQLDESDKFNIPSQAVKAAEDALRHGD